MQHPSNNRSGGGRRRKQETSLKGKENEGERGQGAEMKAEYLRSEQSLSFSVKCEEIVSS